MNIIHWGDCFEVLSDLDSESIDLILSDPPYGSTESKWDYHINVEEFWKLHNRVIKDRGVIAITATQPFASRLIIANEAMFKYDLIWKKNKSTNYLNAKKQPLRAHEHILIFYKMSPVYYPQKTEGHKPVNAHTKLPYEGVYGKTTKILEGGGQTDRYPTSILSFPVVNNDDPLKFHANQKPQALFEWLIKSYTQEGDTIFDGYLGSGTTAAAAKALNRNFIGAEIDLAMYHRSVERCV